MGISYRVVPEDDIAFVVWDGLITADGFLSHVVKLRADPDWPPEGRRHLTDLRTATLDTSIDENVIKKAADLYGEHPKMAELRVAIVAGPSFEKAGMFERFAARYRPYVFVFNTLNPACAWLGIDVNDAERTLRTLRGQPVG